MYQRQVLTFRFSWNERLEKRYPEESSQVYVTFSCKRCNTLADVIVSNYSSAQFTNCITSIVIGHTKKYIVPIMSPELKETVFQLTI